MFMALRVNKYTEAKYNTRCSVTFSDIEDLRESRVVCEDHSSCAAMLIKLKFFGKQTFQQNANLGSLAHNVFKSSNSARDRTDGRKQTKHLHFKQPMGEISSHLGRPFTSIANTKLL